jgi:hypothetical protein
MTMLFCVCSGTSAFQCLEVEFLARGLIEIRGGRRRVAVIGGGCAHRLEDSSLAAMRRQVSRPGRNILAGEFAEARNVDRKILKLGVDYRIGAIRRDDPAVPVAVTYGLVVFQGVEW